MPPRKPGPTTNTETHKTTIVLPSELYQDLRLLVALEPAGTIQGLVERAVRELVEREHATLVKLRQLKAERAKQR